MKLHKLTPPNSITIFFPKPSPACPLTSRPSQPSDVLQLCKTGSHPLSFLIPEVGTAGIMPFLHSWERNSQRWWFALPEVGRLCNGTGY